MRDERYSDRKNISRKSEREFYNDKRFYLATWSCMAVGFLTWIWSLCLMSEDVKFTSYYFSKMKPQTWPQLTMFYYMLAFIYSVEGNCGHEMIHRREWYNKLLGT